jgi:hypothetical protein
MNPTKYRPAVPPPKPRPAWTVDDLLASHFELVRKVQDLEAQVEWLRANHQDGDNR